MKLKFDDIDVATALPYRVTLQEVADRVEELLRDREMYKRRCIMLVAANDKLAAEVEKLKAKRRKGR